MKKLREEFSVFKKLDGELVSRQNDVKGETPYDEVKLAVKKPNHESQRDADFMYAKYMNQYLKEGIMPQIKLEEVIRKNGIWDDEKEKRERELVKTVQEGNEKLRRGKIKQSDAAKIAKDCIKARGELFQLGSQKNSIMSNSAESLAQNHRFNYLAAVCTVYSTSGQSYFKDYDEFLKQDNLGNIVPFLAGEALARLMYSFDDDFRKDWPEYKFLEKYKFVNAKLEWMDKEGNLTDFDGKKLEKVDETVKPVDAEPEFFPDEDVPSSESVENKELVAT